MTIQELLQSLNVEFVESGNHHCRPGWIQLRDCPYCGSIKYHFGYNLQRGHFNCWKCGGHHTIPVLIKFGLPFQEAKAFFEEREAGYINLPERKRGGLKEPAGRGLLMAPHINYLEGRGFDAAELARTWELEGIGVTSSLSWRVYIPILWKGQRVSWTTRAIGDKVQQRYISAGAGEEAVNHKHLVYGIDYCLHSIVVVEGPADAWRIGPGAGALFGTGFETAQVRKLIAIPNRFIAFDNSREAQRRAHELAEQLSPFPGTTQVLQIDAPDPGTAPLREVKLIRKIARLS